MSEAVILNVMLEGKSIKFVNPELIIKKKPGEHVEAVLSGILEYGNGSVTIVPDMELQIYRKGTETVLFQGLVNRVDRKVISSGTDPLDGVELTALSYSCLFDREKKNRSFQNGTQTYDAAAGVAVNAYPDSGMIIQPELAGRQLERLTVQYQETDWEFLKRLASRLNCSIVASHITKGPKLFFGPAWSGSRHIITEDEADEVSEIMQANQKYPGFGSFCWVTKKSDRKVMDIGDRIQYMRIDFYIRELEIHVKNYEIRHQYLSCSKEAFLVPETRNPQITGLSLPGAVADVSSNQIKVKLDIDVWGECNRWYTYATFYSMFYCMPERGDRVYLYFPENREDTAYVLNSVKGSTGAGGSFAGGPGLREAIKPDLKEIPADGEGIVDITSYMNNLASQPEGTLADFEVAFADGANLSKTALMGAAGQAGASGGSVTTLPVQNSEFQSLAEDDKVKVLATSDGKMVVLNDRTGSVSIFLNESTYVVLDGDGIKIRSPQQVTVSADGNISINAKKFVAIKAEESLSVQCGRSTVLLEPSSTIINGTNIKLNE